MFKAIALISGLVQVMLQLLKKKVIRSANRVNGNSLSLSVQAEKQPGVRHVAISSAQI